MYSSMKITYISPLIRTKLVNFLVAMTNFPMIVDKVQISTNYKKSILKFSVILFIALDRTGTILPVERETNPIKNLLKCITSKSNRESTKYLLLLQEVSVMVFNATFNNISIISWRSVLLVEETDYTEKTTDLSQVTDKHYHHNVISSTSCRERGSNAHLWL
jgi:hypothetical protein